MASSTVYHARSISLPSRPHPVAEQLDEQLSRLRSSQSTSTTSSSSTLNSLTNLYSSVTEFLLLPLIRQALSQNQNEINNVLDASLRLLEICSVSRDALQLSRERLHDLQSALRRRCSGELSITSEAKEYLNTRKSIKKAVKKCLKNLKPATERKDETQTQTAVSTLNDVQEQTTDILKSLMSCIAAGSQKSGWSVVTKLMNKNNMKVVKASSKFDDVDATLNSLICQKKSASQMEELRSQILELETEIQDVDEALECLFRNLVKTRATLLNIVSY